jgi:O-acetyl-ADP-ribose deacetylase
MISLRATVGNIVKQNVSAIVNAANTSLLGGSGVDGAIHRAAGPTLAQECLKLGGCKPGQAKITSAHNIPVDWIIHTVGPVWQGGGIGEADVLKACYLNSLAYLVTHNLNSVAFPCISTGIYGFPKALAAEIAVQTTVDFLGSLEDLGRHVQVVFVCYNESDIEHYQTLNIPPLTP